LSFVSSFFSMTTGISALTGTFWVYFCVSLPISLLAFVLVDWERASGWFQSLCRHHKRS